MLKIGLLNRNGIYDGFIHYAKKFKPDWIIGQPQKPDIFLTWNDVLPTFAKTIESLNAKGIPTVCTQHGIEAFDHYFKKDYKPIAKYHLAWDSFDAWCAKERGARNVKIIGMPLWDCPEVKVDNLPDKFMLYIPKHAAWEQEAIQHEFEDAKIRAKYFNLPLVVKLLGTQDCIVDNSIIVHTHPNNPEHLGKCIYLVNRATKLYIYGKQTAKILFETRDKPVIGNSMKIIHLIEDICGI